MDEALDAIAKSVASRIQTYSENLPKLAVCVNTLANSILSSAGGVTDQRVSLAKKAGDIVQASLADVGHGVCAQAMVPCVTCVGVVCQISIATHVFSSRHFSNIDPCARSPNSWSQRCLIKI